MKIINSSATLQEFVAYQHQHQLRVGFIPTMGALHEGHLELIRQSIQSGNQVHICSIFVNPKQFNDAKDLEKYPRPIEADIQKLESVGCSVLFLPDYEQIYPENWQRFPFQFANLDTTMEGVHRTGHFEGVAQVVYRLLQICTPDQIFMGQKDFQQVAIVRSLMKQAHLEQKIELVRVPTVRELDGLAMSSRNIRLSAEGRKRAVFISKTLFWLQANYKNLTPNEAQNQSKTQLQAQGLDEIDYLEIIDAFSLQPVEKWEDALSVVVCVVVRIDGVRLLDNVILY
jgi:pantoate--beta-alanine ligase